ncbi:MAG TPA: hypothetical protein VGK59_08030 [Ohtaekwangia sp.]
MRILLFYFIVLLFTAPSCSKHSGANIRTVKPKYHHRWYDRKKDRHTKRTKTIRVQN